MSLEDWIVFFDFIEGREPLSCKQLKMYWFISYDYDSDTDLFSFKVSIITVIVANNGETVLYIADRFGFDRARSQVDAYVSFALYIYIYIYTYILQMKIVIKKY